MFLGLDFQRIKIRRLGSGDGQKFAIRDPILTDLLQQRTEGITIQSRQHSRAENQSVHHACLLRLVQDHESGCRVGEQEQSRGRPALRIVIDRSGKNRTGFERATDRSGQFPLEKQLRADFEVIRPPGAALAGLQGIVVPRSSAQNRFVVGRQCRRKHELANPEDQARDERFLGIPLPVAGGKPFDGHGPGE